MKFKCKHTPDTIFSFKNEIFRVNGIFETENMELCEFLSSNRNYILVDDSQKESILPSVQKEVLEYEDLNKGQLKALIIERGLELPKELTKENYLKILRG